jgi:hypothetical protein
VPLSLLRLTEPKRGDEAYLGTFADASHYDHLVDASTRVLRPDGSTLCCLIREGIGREAGLRMYESVRGRISATQNRGTATGGRRPTRVRRDGVLSKQSEAKPVLSGIMGFFDRSVRLPFCRSTAFVEKHPQAYRACLPALQEADAVFAQYMPEAYARQKEVAERTSPDFLIPKTTFTTITLNKNFRTAFHKDAGDFPEGFGVMSYYRSGRFTGGYLVFPAWRVALKMDSLDLVLFDPHEVHGNTDILAYTQRYERITCVHYYRKDMVYCGSAAQELKLAQDHDTRRGPRKIKARVDG